MCEIHLPKIEIQCSYVKSTTERNIVNYANGRYKTRKKPALTRVQTPHRHCFVPRDLNR